MENEEITLAAIMLAATMICFCLQFLYYFGAVITGTFPGQRKDCFDFKTK